MKIALRIIITIIATTCTMHTRTAYAQKREPLQGMQIAAKHPVISNKPSPGFFEGALLGNGGMGVNVTTRPDAIVLYFGHNNVWDIRLAENHKEALGTFKEVFDKVKKIPASHANLTDDPWYRQYVEMAGDNYRKPYPRPFPCGSVLLGFDRRKVQMLGHKLDISTGLCTVNLLTNDKKLLMLKIFTDMDTDRLLMQLVDVHGQPAANIFTRVRVMPDPSTPGDMPHYEATENLQEGILSFRQILPFGLPGSKDAETGSKKDKAFRLTVKLNTPLIKSTKINWNGATEHMNTLEAALSPNATFSFSATLNEGFATNIPVTVPTITKPNISLFNNAFSANQLIWKNYWSKSAVSLDDVFLEKIWYQNLYFLNCAVKAGVTCPGLFANWSYNNIGTAWHGDYHMNYNTQQPFWVTFSSNHLEKNLPYVSLINNLLPVSKKWANEYYNLPGAYFPHSAYPVEMSINPYPLPDWGWEVSETPWAVQGLWWHYLYSGDKEFLEKQAYIPIKAACQFLTAYMKRHDAHGGDRWKDDKYHIFPTVAPELFALQPGFKYNYDCGVDLSLTKFVFKAFKQAAVLLNKTAQEKVLLSDIDDILNHFPDYPIAVSPTHGKVLVAVPGEGSETVYNVPDALFAAFPGEDFGLHSNKETQKLLKQTYLNQQNEGGNDLVFINMQAARIGMLDLDDFKRHVNYSLLPNGTATDMVMQVHGRYQDNSDYAYMAGMGIWFENFALPAVINECLMQSYSGTIRLFPNWPANKSASFSQLRAAGAFLVSADKANSKVTRLTVKSEKGDTLKILSPWGKKGWIIKNGKSTRISTNLIVLPTKTGDLIEFKP